MAKAKRLRVPYTRANVKRAVEEDLDDATRLVAEHHRRPQSASFTHFAAQQSGMFHLASKLGFDCRCDPMQAEKGIPSCACEEKSRGITPGRKMYYVQPGHPGYTFDGLNCRATNGLIAPLGRCHGLVNLAGLGKTEREGCRDPRDGSFVPVAQCNPPWARKMMQSGKRVEVEVLPKRKRKKKGR